MFEIRNVYRKFDKRKKEIIALNDINLTFPSEGLIFICGRSGSGKSTLLNSLGGLDTPTSGMIFFNDIKVNALNSSDMAKYRNEYIGFIFQDFALLETLTVFENVKLALDIKHQKNNEEVTKVLKDLEILNLADKVVTRLSAGQKQRVAVARAIVKHPKVILADEPTGNLDHESGEIVLKYLKKISKDCLVIIISHNENDAYKFGDRIIRLKKGKVVSDIFTNNNERKYKIDDTILYLNDAKDLTKKELNGINNNLKKGQICELKPITDTFLKVEEENFPKEETKLIHYRVKSRYIRKLYEKLIGKRIFSTLIFSIISMVMVCLMALCQMLLSFDYESVVTDVVRQSNDTNVTLVKNAIKNGNIVKTTYNILTSEEENNLKDVSEGTDYYVLNNFSPLHSLTLGNVTTPSLYSTTAYGTIITNEEFLCTLFDTDLTNLYAKKCNEISDYGIYITDYFYDALVSNSAVISGGDFSQNLGVFSQADMRVESCYINGIINTGYKTKFADLINKETVDKDSSEYLDFVDYIRHYLSVSYSFNPNLMNDVTKLNKNYFYSKKASLKINGTTYKRDKQLIRIASTLNENEIKIGPKTLQALFEMSKSAVEWENYFKENNIVTLDASFDNANGESFKIDNLTIQVSTISGDDWIYLPSERYYSVLKIMFGDYGIVYTNKEDALNIYKKYSSTGINVAGVLVNSANTIFKLVNTYFDLFKFIGLLLFITSMCLIIYMSYSAVKSRKYDIGVLKAMGMSNRDINRIYFLNLFITYIFYAIFYVTYLFSFRDIGNLLLVSAIKATSGLNSLSFDVFVIRPITVYFDVGLILASSLIGLLIPILHIKFIKPIDMLRSKY